MLFTQPILLLLISSVSLAISPPLNQPHQHPPTHRRHRARILIPHAPKPDSTRPVQLDLKRQLPTPLLSPPPVCYCCFLVQQPRHRLPRDDFARRAVDVDLEVAGEVAVGTRICWRGGGCGHVGGVRPAVRERGGWGGRGWLCAGLGRGRGMEVGVMGAVGL